MGKLVRNMIIGALVFAAVGCLLGLAAPAIAAALQSFGLISAEVAAAHAATNVFWTTAFFGAFGALVPPVQHIIHSVFGDDAKQQLLAQQQQNARLESKLAQLESREQILETAIAPQAAQAARVQAILSQGARAKESFVQAEEAPKQAPGSPTIH